MFNGNSMNGCNGLDPSMIMMGIMMNNMMQNMNNMFPNNMNMNNMNMNMNNMNMNNMNMNNMNMNNMNNMNMEGNNMNYVNNCQNIQQTPGKVNLIFVTTNGIQTNMQIDYGTSVKRAIELYLLRVGLEDLIGNIDNQLHFINNAKKININDSRKVEDVFQGAQKIIVNDVHNLIGA